MRRMLLPCVVVCLAPFALAAQQTPPPPPPAAPHDTVRGAVQMVDVRNRTLEVTTGVGYALRVVRLEVPPTAPVIDKREDARISLSDLKPGDVIRVLYGTRVGRELAYTVERLGRMETGADTTP